jgi:hypothetical protein
MNRNYAMQNVNVKDRKEKIRTTQANAIANRKDIKQEARVVQENLKAEKRACQEKNYGQVNLTSRREDGQDLLPVRRNEGLPRREGGHGLGGKSRRIKRESEHREVRSEGTALETAGTQEERWRDQQPDFECRNP